MARRKTLQQSSQPPHPIERFEAPTAISTGSPLKLLLGRELVELIADSLEPHRPGFNRAAFVQQAAKGLDKLELKQRGEHIAQAMAAQLDADFEVAAEALISSLGPELSSTAGNGLRVFFYWPHSHYISQFGSEHFASGMRANYELTKRFTAEFSLRPFVIQHETKCLKLLEKWTRDPNPHVRRLVSEGTRPRLPWGMRLPNVQANPTLTLPLLERLKDDPELYVRRSVANHLADILKDQPDAAYETCERWLEEVSAVRIEPQLRKARHWILRHAVRLPAQQGSKRALQLRLAAK